MTDKLQSILDAAEAGPDGLKRCPYCGNYPLLTKSEGSPKEWDIECITKQRQCFIPINNFPFKTKAAAIKAWNERWIPVPALGKALERAVREIGTSRERFKTCGLMSDVTGCDVSLIHIDKILERSQ